MQETTPAGLKPAAAAKRRVEIACIHNATAGAEDAKLIEMWAARATLIERGHLKVYRVYARRVGR